ncbi:MAG: acyl-CoA dehydrogenase family protein [Myxococcota bacterium]
MSATDAPAALREARALHAEIASRGDEIESGRRLPPELARKFAASGLFSICVPKQYGGGELSAADAVRVIEEIARADGAAGWVVMIGATTGMLAASLSDAWAREIYGRNPQVITGGVTAPTGVATPAEGGHRVTGRWSFASGCQHSDWLVGGTRMGAADAPEARLMFFAPEQFRIHDTWHASGLRGTGSHDFEVEDAFVPDGRSVVLGGHPRVSGALYQFPTLGLLALGVCAVALGIARRALDEFVTLAGGKVPTGSARTLANRPVVQRQVGEAEAALRSARAYVFASIDAAWEIANQGRSLPIEQRAELRLGAANAAWRAAQAVDLVYHAGGGTAVYSSSPLQRCFRDVHVATQHIMVAQPLFEIFGRSVLGLPVEKGTV